MTITNRYVKRSRISEAKFREFVKNLSVNNVLPVITNQIHGTLFIVGN
jgi:hypothetical protein